MKSKPRISVIVPVFQVGIYLRRCIDSIIEQTYSNIEIILIDDGSFDGGEKICDEYQEKDFRIIVKHQKNKGLVSARKAGINVASGEYIVYVDGDDWIENNYIENFAKAILNNDKPDIVWGTSYWKDYGENRQLSGYLELSSEKLKNKKKQDELLDFVKGEYGFQNKIAFSICAKCFKKEFVKEIQESIGNKISFDEDFSLMCRCLANEPKVCFIRNDGYHYFQRDDSMTHGNDQDDVNQVMLDETLEYVRERNKDKIAEMVKIQYYISMIEHGGLEKLQRDDSDIIFPFKNALKSKNVVVYGIGNMGKSFVDYIQKTKICNIVAGIDRNFNDKAYRNIPIIELNTLKEIDFDYVLISTIKEDFISEIMKSLMSVGVGKDRIAYLDYLLLKSN